MFCRTKTAKGQTYLQIVESYRANGRTRQRVVASLGRLDRLAASGGLDRLIQSACRFSETLLALSEADSRSRDPAVRWRSIGPALLFGALWEATGCADILRAALKGRRFGFDVERAVFASVLHRIMVSGSDRQACRWMRDQPIPGTAGLELHQFYRAMAWLGSPLAGEEAPEGKFSPRCTKDGIEEALFFQRRDLYTNLDMVFFDTTSLYFHGEGGTELGRHGKSKDFRPQCKQLVVGLVLDGDGDPVASEIWPGNTADVKALDRVAARLQERFGLRSICVVADRGMISRETIASIEARGWHFILGARHRNSKEIKEKVLTDSAPFETVAMPRARNTPLELEVKEVHVKDGKAEDGEDADEDAEASSRRTVVCRNPAQARKDAATREAILKKLHTKLEKGGPKGLVGNRGFKRYLRAKGGVFEVDYDKIQSEERFDGLWVLHTNTDFEPGQIAARYKALWMVEQVFRTSKALLDTRPIFHKCDETIRGHVFCSFLALVLQSELQRRMQAAGIEAEWADIRRDLNALTETEIEQDGKRFLVRSATQGSIVAILRCAGARLPQTIRQIETAEHGETLPATE